MPDYGNIFIKLDERPVLGFISVFDRSDVTFAHLSIAEILPQYYAAEDDVCSAFIESVRHDCLIIDIGKIIVTDDNMYGVLAFLLRLLIWAQGDVLFLAGPENDNNYAFLQRHFHTTAPVFHSLADAIRNYGPASPCAAARQRDQGDRSLPF